MNITYTATSTDPQFNGQTEQAALTGVVNAINEAIRERITATGGVSNLQVIDVFGNPTDADLLNRGEPEQLNFSQLNYYFRSSPDVSELVPLQGVEGVAAGGRRRKVGEVSTSLQVSQFTLNTFDVISEIGTFFSTARDGAKHKKYGTRILGFYIVGSRNGAARTRSYFPGDAGRLAPIAALTPDGAGDNELTVANMEALLPGINARSMYQVGIFKTPLFLRLRTVDDEWRTLINVGANKFKGDSSTYLNSLGFVTSLTAAGSFIDGDTTTQVTFALDFELINHGDGDGPYGSYEMDYQSTNTNRNLLIDQQGSSRTWSIPSVSAFDVEIGSPFSSTKTRTRTTQKETTGQQQILEKAIIQLPAVYYQLKNFTSISIDNVSANIWVTSNTGGKTKLTVPLGKKLLLVATPENVAKAVIASI